ncbi:MAG: hypothetical protein K6T90_20610 [Leptolyngbyaceae cyanobacterium HOT.MB2.61]|nr:hypothetical protein [Leptolyngbyaceae cyanobacterium HOT.MB2.61]
MEFTFEILGVSPVLQFFNYQQEVLEHKPPTGVAYLGSYKCTLDALIETVETVTPSREWELDRVVEAVISFWMNNMEAVRHWQQRLENADGQNILVSRLADLKSLQLEFERLLNC